MSDFESKTSIPLDHVYNGKAMFGLCDLITKDYFKPNTNILYLHTGGLQGLQGLRYIQNKKKDHHTG
jgi:1-aminocyclopropane-1-carboxylate deaminase